MQKQDPIDDLFRRELEDYKVTPSDERRETFMRDAAKEFARRSSKRWWIMGIGAGLLITAGVGLLVREEKPAEKRMEVRHENSEVKVVGNIINGKTDKNIVVVKKLNEVKEKPVVVKENVSRSNSRTQMNDALTASRSSRLQDHQGAVASIVKPSGQPQAAANVQPASQVALAKTDIKERPGEGRDAGVTEDAVTPSDDHQQKVRPEARNEGKVTDYRKKSSLPKKWNINAGVYYAPEWMFNTLNGDKFANNMGVEGTFHFGRYSVRTGVGLSITTGSNEILVQTNPYLGSYYALDSIIFRWNDNNTSLVPTLYTSSANAYDTVLRYNYSYMKKRYTYLQVPLVLGYDFWQNDWLSLGVRGGAVMSLLLRSENLSATYDPGKDRIISINNISPDRIHLNWQAVGGINATFMLSRRLSIELEPDVRYYFNSVYESSVLIKKPWSVGVRAAFLITF